MTDLPGSSKTPIEVAAFLLEKGIPELTCEVFEGECSYSNEHFHCFYKTFDLETTLS